MAKSLEENLNVGVMKKALEQVDEEFKYCLEHCEYFIESYVKIEDKDSADVVSSFKLWKEQREALQHLLSDKRVVALKARQIGITWLALSYAAWNMLRGGYSVMALSRSEDEAKELVRRMAFIFDHMPFASRIKEKKPYTKVTFDSNALLLTVWGENGLESTFKAFASSPSAGRSFTGNLLIFDEWAFQAFAKEIFTAAYPAINRPNGGQFIGISTMELGTWFEEIWCNDNNGFIKIFIPWYADPKRDEKWYKDTLSTIGEDAMHREYPATAEEALSIPGGAYFPEINENVHIKPTGRHSDCRWYIALDYGLDMLSAGLFAIDMYGYATMTAEINRSGLIVSQAAEQVKHLATFAEDKIFCYIAPPDLWNRRQDTGRSAADIFGEHGVPLIKAVNTIESGCRDLKEWLKPQEALSDQTGNTYMTAYITFEESIRETIHCLKAIQKDKTNANIYAKDPHRLTHAVDMLRYFCAGRPIPSNGIKMYEDNYEADDNYESFINYGR